MPFAQPSKNNNSHTPTRILYIARYRDASMHRKVALLAQQGGFSIRYIFPQVWQDELVHVKQNGALGYAVDSHPVRMVGPMTDPHRVMYGSLSFGMRTFRPDIVYAEEEPDSLAGIHIAVAKRIFAPKAKLALYTWQNIYRPRPIYVNGVMGVTLRAADAIVCANQEAVKVLQQWGYHGIMPVILAIGVDTTIFTPQVRPVPENHLVRVGYVGRFVPEKGIDTLITAIGQITKHEAIRRLGIRLVLIGNGRSRADLVRLIGDMGISQHVDILPSMPPAEVAREMNRLDMLVLPSRTTKTWKEQFGRVMIEAMACKVPVIGSNSGAIPEVLGDAGLIYPEGDAQALADQIVQLALTPALRTELSEKGYNRVMRYYTQEKVAQETGLLYQTLLTARTGTDRA